MNQTILRYFEFFSLVYLLVWPAISSSAEVRKMRDLRPRVLSPHQSCNSTPFNYASLTYNPPAEDTKQQAEERKQFRAEFEQRRREKERNRERARPADPRQPPLQQDSTSDAEHQLGQGVQNEHSTSTTNHTTPEMGSSSVLARANAPINLVQPAEDSSASAPTGHEPNKQDPPMTTTACVPQSTLNAYANATTDTNQAEHETVNDYASS